MVFTCFSFHSHKRVTSLKIRTEESTLSQLVSTDSTYIKTQLKEQTLQLLLDNLKTLSKNSMESTLLELLPNSPITSPSPEMIELMEISNNSGSLLTCLNSNKFTTQSPNAVSQNAQPKQVSMLQLPQLLVSPAISPRV